MRYIAYVIGMYIYIYIYVCNNILFSLYNTHKTPFVFVLPAGHSASSFGISQGV
jgi:hypothetical protein